MRTTTVGVRFTKEERELVERVAKDEYLNISVLIRKVILEYANSKEK